MKEGEDLELSQEYCLKLCLILSDSNQTQPPGQRTASGYCVRLYNVHILLEDLTTHLPCFCDIAQSYVSRDVVNPMSSMDDQVTRITTNHPWMTKLLEISRDHPWSSQIPNASFVRVSADDQVVPGIHSSTMDDRDIHDYLKIVS